MSVEPYPLLWPSFRPRTPKHKRFRSRFGAGGRGTGLGWARDHTLAELSRLGAANVVINSDLRTRQDGLPYTSQREPEDVGVCVFFVLEGQHPHVLCCDQYDRIADNLLAIGKYVEALRGQLRWGVADTLSAFAGFRALPEVTPWFRVLGVQPDATAAEINASFRQLARSAHPDAGGTVDRMAELNAARDAGIKARG